MKALEENIYGLIKMKKKYHVQSILLYDDYNSLFQAFLRYNPQKVRFSLFRPFYLEKLYCQRKKLKVCP